MMQFSYSNLGDGKWGVKAATDLGEAAGLTGQTVTVTKRDGSAKRVVLGPVLDRWNGDRAAVYAIAKTVGMTKDERALKRELQADDEYQDHERYQEWAAGAAYVRWVEDQARIAALTAEFDAAPDKDALLATATAAVKWAIECLPHTMDYTDVAAERTYRAVKERLDTFETLAYGDTVANLVRSGWAARTQVGEDDRGAFYDTTTYAITVRGADANRVREVLAQGDGQSMASYGTFGGYSTIGRVAQTGPDAYTVESVYHIGD